MFIDAWVIGIGSVALVAFGVVLALATNWAAGYMRQLKQDNADLKSAGERLARSNDELKAKNDDLEQRVAKLENREKHGLSHWTQANLAEVAIMDWQNVFEGFKSLEGRFQNGLMRLTWMRSGGEPDASWTEIVKWWKKQQKKVD